MSWGFGSVEGVPHLLVEVTGSSQDLRGLHANRPAATAVAAGSTYWSVDEPAAPGTVFVTDGADWQTVAAL